MKSVDTLILLANEHDMRLLTHAGKGQPLLQIAHHGVAEWADATRRYADREGRMRNGAGPISALDRSTSERAQNRQHFASHVLDITGTEWATRRHERLVIAAPAKMLGQLRAAMPPELTEALQADLDADLLHLALDRMGDHLKDVVAL